ncbi:MAG: enoyl-CoA hydratase [Gammaproteobacteria bacterium]|nr:MAG: enoyl-CoA hydratase [Gammaproteobacteria bacterium]TDJ39295.1 MAG: enoyl-CoA hydratase [Gammaproteobacteria bacterium]
MTDHLIETQADGIATLTMNRPEVRNAMSGEMMAALTEALPRLAADQAIRVVVLTGAGGAFCAGGDVKGFASDASSGSGAGNGSGGGGFNLEQRVQGLRTSMELSRWLHEMPKPTLAVIPGAAAGAGLSLALACDLRIAADTAKLTTAFSKVGLSGDYGGSYFLPYLVGAAKARELYFTADVISGQQAFDMGLVNKVAPADHLESEAQAFATHLAGLPTVAIGYMKKNLNAAQHGSLSDVMDLEAMHMIRTFMTEDHKGAAQAFVEKRAPQFEGR